MAFILFFIFHKSQNTHIPKNEFSNNNGTGTAFLEWNHNKENDLGGYKIYYGTAPRTSSCPPGGYQNKIDIENKTEYNFNNLEKGGIYYFSVSAYNKSGKESCFSQEVAKKIN